LNAAASSGQGAGLVEDVTVAVGGDGEAVGDVDPLVGEPPVHLADGGVLAPHRGDVGVPDLVEATGVAECGHVSGVRRARWPFVGAKYLTFAAVRQDLRHCPGRRRSEMLEVEKRF
jgi:hypothetical protein